MIHFHSALRKKSDKGDSSSLGGIPWKKRFGAQRRLLSGEWSQI